MQEHLNENTLFNTVAMLLKDVYDRVLVVEGPDDHLLLKRHVPASLTIQECLGRASSSSVLTIR